jgi:CRP/FNR family cyclic AMP-dependent transcriptional regulator
MRAIRRRAYAAPGEAVKPLDRRSAQGYARAVDERVVHGLSLFSSLSKTAAKRIAPLLEEIDVDTGRELAHEGEIGYELFCIVEGSATVTKGGEHVADLGPGDFFGEIALHDEARRRTSTVVAATPMRLAVMLGHDVRFVERELPEVAEQIRAAIAARTDGAVA